MSENCKKCNPENGECDFCPHSSSGKLNLNKRMYGDEPDIDLYDPVLSDDLYDY